MEHRLPQCTGCGERREWPSWPYSALLFDEHSTVTMELGLTCIIAGVLVVETGLGKPDTANTVGAETACTNTPSSRRCSDGS